MWYKIIQWHSGASLAMARTKITLRFSDDLYWKLDRLARHLDRSLNGAAQIALRRGIMELSPPPQRMKPLAN
jgi:hypothetical protein